jgi:hypothetical protein
MKYQDLVDRMGSLPVIESSSLRMFWPDPRALSVQLDRWVKSGRLIRLRRGAYLLPEYLRRGPAPPERIANLLHRPSYVSLERALMLHGLIPEAVPVVTSVTTGKPRAFDTPAGRFRYRHVKRDWFFGYREVEAGKGTALVAAPEKALLDLVHLSRGEFTSARLEELRLQNLEALSPELLSEMTDESRATPRVRRAAERILGLIGRRNQEAPAA